MRKPDLLRGIYAELRRGLGPDVPANDLLKLAHVILRSYTDDGKQDDYPSTTSARAFVSLPVDEAMRDGGWRVLEFERMRGILVDNIDSDTVADVRPLIEKYLGPEWRYQQTPTDPL